MIDEVDNEELGAIKGIETAPMPPDASGFAKTLPRGYMSVSQTEQYMKCGEAYYRRYVLEQKIPSSTFSAQGRSVHKSAEILHLSIMGGQPIGVEQMVQVYSDQHDIEIVDAVNIGDEPDPGKLKDVGIGLTRKYHAAALGGAIDDVSGKACTAIQPIAAERVIRTILTPENSDPIPFMGVIDVEELDAVIDLKTKRKAASQGEADNSLQLSLYAHITGKPLVRLDQLIKPTKTMGTRFTRTESIRTKTETLHAVDIVAESAADIAAGRFRKTNPANWWCTDRWCPYWSDCRGKAR
jgi:hypothetical protein